MCTRVLWNDNDLGIFAGRTMDWPESTEPVLTVAPRGYQRHGGKVGPVDIAGDNALEWKSRYGSIITSVSGIGTVDGFNEKGLGARSRASIFAVTDLDRFDFADGQPVRILDPYDSGLSGAVSDQFEPTAIAF